MAETCTICGKALNWPQWRKRREVKQPTCSRRCKDKLPRDRERNPAWKGGRRKNLDGYQLVYMPGHHRAHAGSAYVLEQILVAEENLGRPLTETEEIHHIDRDRSNNDWSNLVVYPDHSSHMAAEHSEFEEEMIAEYGEF